jgi:hypothetical protein
MPPLLVPPLDASTWLGSPRNSSIGNTIGHAFVPDTSLLGLANLVQGSTLVVRRCQPRHRPRRATVFVYVPSPMCYTLHDASPCTHDMVCLAY